LAGQALYLVGRWCPTTRDARLAPGRDEYGALRFSKVET
jgi:hypothetical protein